MSTRGGRVLAQGKINLRLRVLSKEQSGYHGVETIFARIDLADDVVVKVDGAGRSVDCRWVVEGTSEVIPAERNLAYRAASAYQEACGWPGSFAIEIDKRIPAAGGLGGGSADAGAVLRILNFLNSSPLEAKTLLAIAGTLGADVPAMASESPTNLAWGRGDRLLAFPALPRALVLLVCPSFGVASSDAYSWFDEQAEQLDPVTESAQLTLAQLGSWPGVAEVACNDLEPVVVKRYPQIGALVRKVRLAGARIAMMSGSGSAVFGVFDSSPIPAEMADDAPFTNGRSVVTGTATSVVGVEVLE
ncbi:MAG: 4-(cytidine 5'-diphospho)-2-C-methyl-D-erythritol kinase [Gemmatimonadaceae bacterium]